jgi:PII-like signaling protein
MKTPEPGQLLRIFIDESEKYHGHLLYETIVYKARELNIAGATVLKGMMGYGADSKIHTSKILRLSDSMPVIVEMVDSEEKITKILPFLEETVKDGLITIENVRVIRYRHD